MGNCDGNITVECDRTNSNETSKLNNMSKFLFFPSQKESSLKMVKGDITDKMSASSRIFTTKVKGQLIAFPTQSYSKLAEIEDFRVENSETEEEPSSKFSLNSSQAADSSNENGAKLKFGIESILNSESSKKTEKTCQCFHDPKSSSNTLLVDLQEQVSTKSYLNDQRSAQSPGHEVSRQTSFQFTKNVSLNEEKLKPDSFSMLRNAKNIRHHPYPKFTFERSHSDPACHPTVQPTQSPDRIRRKSESPVRSAFSSCSFSKQTPSTVTDILSKRFESNELCANRESKRLSETPSLTTTQTDFSPTGIHLSLKKCISTSQRFPMHNSFKLSDKAKGSLRYSEPDEVFRDNSEETHQKIAAANSFQHILKQRNFLTRSSNSNPSSPNASSPLEKHKFNSMRIFPSVNQYQLNPFHVASPSNFNFQSWQNLSANYQPAMFRQILNPYVCNQTAAAVALSYIQSLKSVSHQNMMMLSDGLQMNKSSPSSSFGFRSTDSEMHSNPEKQFGMKSKRRKWTRAVFSILQRRALEDSFKGQKYVAKPERRFLAERLGLTDAQVKIWFQNRRMKWRQEQKNKLSVGSEDMSPPREEENFRQLQAHT